MGLHPGFPADPHVLLDPAVRWYPGEEVFTETGQATLLPPLVHRIRQGVKAWRDSGYEGASDTTRALLRHWFETEHALLAADGTLRPFRYYFAQREAVESAVWLYEVEEARDPYALIRYDASGRVSKGMFAEDWTRYVLKLATGAGKTKVMSLLIAWAYFHRRYEEDSDLSTNFLVLAPNIIVLDRLRQDFDGLRIFHEDPILPENGHEGRSWQDDFQVTLHIQDEIGVVSDTGNLFLSNVHRLADNTFAPSFEDDDTSGYFLGRRPSGKANGGLDLGQIVRDVEDLVIFNDEAHHIHDEELAWFKNIADISSRLRLKGSRLSAQFDLTATPKHTNGAIFVQTVADYPLVEAIRQGVVKTPVLPDAASRAKLTERASDKFTERYEDYLHLGYLEWQKVYDELSATKKPVLFVMTDDTRNCDEVGAYLEARYPELRGGVLVIHTKRNGEIAEAAKGKDKEELERLRRMSREIDLAENPYKAIVSVMMLREGWDVQNVVTIVGLRPYKAASRILPEQTLGRGLRRMFRGEEVVEKVSVVGTDAFVDFVESIRSEGVELEYAPMGQGGPGGGKSPLVIEVDRQNEKKDLERLDMELPILSPRLYREFKNLEALDAGALPPGRLPLKQFSPEEQREIVFKDLNTDEVSHKTLLDTALAPTHQAAVGFFARTILRDLRLVGGFDVLFGTLKQYMEGRLFQKPVDLDDLNVLRNLSEPAAIRKILETFKTVINALTVQEKGTTEVRGAIKLSKARPFVVSNQPYLVPKRSVFSKVVTDQGFELDFAGFLDACEDLVSFAKNPQRQPTSLRIEYQTAEGGLANYYPDFLVKETEADYWVVETKGREDVEDAGKWERLCRWCEDASAADASRRYRPLFVAEEGWKKTRPKSFQGLREAFAGARPKTSR
ncbi:MAG: DEAD/DEAH box helicase family protein [Deltaproteobacteria bacterium]|nr:DEAD/DEAH box helicase family protein [Deltaproteobacteria bacterium]